jgi:hypothetical protein
MSSSSALVRPWPVMPQPGVDGVRDRDPGSFGFACFWRKRRDDGGGLVDKTATAFDRGEHDLGDLNVDTDGDGLDAAGGDVFGRHAMKERAGVVSCYRKFGCIGPAEERFGELFEELADCFFWERTVGGVDVDHAVRIAQRRRRPCVVFALRLRSLCELRSVHSTPSFDFGALRLYPAGHPAQDDRTT